MKDFIIRLLHLILGYERYLRYFTRFRITFLNSDKRKHDFLYFEKCLSNDAQIVVIGANTGITTIPFAKGNPNRTVYAYEPLASNFKILENTVQYYALRNIHSYNLALGNKTGHIEMILPIFNGARKHGMAHINDPSIESPETGETFTVEIQKLDDRAELHGTPIHAIKLVAENYELEILKGAKHLITAHKPFIYCELWHNKNRLHTLNLIREYGYDIYYRDGATLKEYTPSAYTGKNFFFKAHA